MALGIDIYRYQKVTDWNAVKRHGVAFIYVKGTDGGGPAIVRADAQVRGANSIGVPVGLYHYAQLTPSPEAQANVLADEVYRTGASRLPPMLDLEDPHRPGRVARDFAARFLGQLKRRGFPLVGLYASTSMLTGISAPQDYDRDGTVGIWAASYGPNDGKRHPLNYGGKVHIHQYASVGVIPGISGQVDLNELLSPLPFGGTDVELTDKIRFWDGFEITVGQALADTWQLANNMTERPTRPDQPADSPPWLDEIRAELSSIRADITELKQRPAAVADVDEAEVVREMEARGFGAGATPAQIVEIMNSLRFSSSPPTS